MDKRIGASELIINPDGSIFHLHLNPGEVADTVLLVGDPGRVALVSAFFDHIEVSKQNREFQSVTGSYHGLRLTVVSTGIGTDNIDIVVNELDALKNIDFNTRLPHDSPSAMRFIRIGTSGAMQENLPVGSRVGTRISIGLDGLMHYYAFEKALSAHWLIEDLKAKLPWPAVLPLPYAFEAGEKISARFSDDLKWGLTVSAHGFYAPQGRKLRGALAIPALNNSLRDYRFQGTPILNFEMESSALYGLSKLLGHEALTICLIVANRAKKEFLEDYKPEMALLLRDVLDRLTDNSDE